MGNQLLATYYIQGNIFNIWACWDKETQENKFDFYDIYDKYGHCINEGNPFYDFPTWAEIKEYLEENNII